MRGEITLSGERFKWEYNDVEVEDTHHEYLQNLGYDGNGKTWEGVVYGLIQEKNPPLKDRVEISSEGDSVIAYSQDQGSLEHLQSIITDAKEDDRLFNSAIRTATNANRLS